MTPSFSHSNSIEHSSYNFFHDLTPSQLKMQYYAHIEWFCLPILLSFSFLEPIVFDCLPLSISGRNCSSLSSYALSIYHTSLPNYMFWYQLIIYILVVSFLALDTLLICIELLSCKFNKWHALMLACSISFEAMPLNISSQQNLIVDCCVI